MKIKYLLIPVIIGALATGLIYASNHYYVSVDQEVRKTSMCKDEHSVATYVWVRNYLGISRSIEFSMHDYDIPDSLVEKFKTWHRVKADSAAQQVRQCIQ